MAKESPRLPTTLLIGIGACFLLSGVTGLMYEVAWSRLLMLVFGTTHLAVTTILSTYFGGMALGSLLFGRMAARNTRPLRLYGLLELGIGAFALASPALIGLVRRAHYGILPDLAQTRWGLAGFRLLLSVLVLLIPTVLMGATLPVLSRFLVRRTESAARSVGLLYGINTIGAVLGTAATGFWLIPGIGVRATILSAAVVNLAVGLWAVAAGATRRQAPAEPQAPSSPESRRIRWLLVAYFLAGAGALACEVAWTRALTLVLGSSVYAFSVMLLTFLAGIALGSLAMGRLTDRARKPLLLFGGIETGVAIGVLLSVLWIGRLPVIFMALFEKGRDSFLGISLLQIGLASLVMILPTFLMGAAFPLVSRIVVKLQGEAGSSVGRVYFANTIGGIVGSLLVGLVLIPTVGSRVTLLGAAILFGAIGLIALGADTPLPLRRKVISLGGLAVALLILGSRVPAWDRLLMTSGVYVYAPELEEGFESGRKFLYYQEGLHSLVAVTEKGGVRSMRINGKTDGSDGADMVTQVLLAEIPLLLHPAPRNALVIGLGTGVTLGSAANHPVTRLDCAEIDDAVVRASRLFNHASGDPLKDPRTRLMVADARTVLQAKGEPYDVIISEPSNPWITGVSNLFTVDHFRACRERLAPEGILCQWIHSYYMAPEDMRTILRGLMDSFPRVWMFQASEGDYLILAYRNDQAVLGNLADRPALTRAVLRDLERIDVQGWPDVAARLRLDPAGMRRLVGEGPRHTDDRPIIEYSAPRSLYRNTHRENARAVEAAALQVVPGSP